MYSSTKKRQTETRAQKFDVQLNEALLFGPCSGGYWPSPTGLRVRGLSFRASMDRMRSILCVTAAMTDVCYRNASMVVVVFSFVEVDFGKGPNYEIILGRPFMHLMKMIQYWGYHFIYQHYPSTTTHISLKESYKDTNYTLVRDMVSMIEKAHSLPSWLVHKELV